MTLFNTQPEIIRFEKLDSTQNKAKELAKLGTAEGTVVLAETQTHGKGSGSRQWHSPNGGLYFSVIFYPKNIKRVTDLSLLAGLAVAQGIKEFLPKSQDVTVKWPNDCLVNWKKVAGVLCETVGDKLKTAVVVGVGINVNIPETELIPFLTNPFSATSFQLVNVGSQSDKEKVLEMILTKMYGLYELYNKEGFAPVQFLWEKNCHFIGKRLELREVGWQSVSDKSSGVTVGTMIGIDGDGALILSNARGDKRQYFTGEITCFWP